MKSGPGAFLAQASSHRKLVHYKLFGGVSSTRTARLSTRAVEGEALRVKSGGVPLIGGLIVIAIAERELRAITRSLRRRLARLRRARNLARSMACGDMRSQRTPRSGLRAADQQLFVSVRAWHRLRREPLLSIRAPP